MPYVTELPSSYISAGPAGILSFSGSPPLSELMDSSIQLSDYKINAHGQTSLSNGDAFTLHSPDLGTISATYLGAGTLAFAPVIEQADPLTCTFTPQPVSGSLFLSEGKYYIVTETPFDNDNLQVEAVVSDFPNSNPVSVTTLGPLSNVIGHIAYALDGFSAAHSAEMADLLRQHNSALISGAHEAATGLSHNPDIDRELSEDEVVCFVAGTLIDTEHGPVAIENLTPGDLIWTKDDGFRPLRWIGSMTLTAEALARSPHLCPIRIRASALAPNIPSRDLLVSPQHRILVSSKIAVKMFGAIEVLIPAKQLLQVEGIDYALDLHEVTYFHMLFDGHQIVGSNGAETESLYTGPQALRSLSPAAREEILTLFPELKAYDYSPEFARPLPSGRQSRRLAQRHAAKGRDLVC